MSIFSIIIFIITFKIFPYTSVSQYKLTRKVTNLKKTKSQIKILIRELKNPNLVPSPEKNFLFRITPFIEISEAFLSPLGN